MKKALFVLLVVLMGINGVFANGQKDDGKIVIGYTFHSDQDVFQHLMKEEVLKAAEAKGWEVKVIDPMKDIEKQLAAVETFISLGVDGVILNPIDWTGSMPAVKMCNDAGIPIVAVNSRLNPEAGDFIYVGSDNYDAGVDSEYGRKASMFSRIDTPAYYGAKISPASQQTRGGVMIDLKARALREDGSAIEGLYIGGETANQMDQGLTEAFVIGRLAGETATADILK